MSAAIAQSIVVSLESVEDPEQIITAIRTMNGVAGVKLVFGDVVAVPRPNSVRAIDIHESAPPEPPATPEEIIRATAEQYRTTVEAILAKDHHKGISEARNVAMFICKKHLRGISFPEVGLAFARDHTTVMSAVRKIESFVACGNRHIVTTIDAIAKRLPKLLEVTPIATKNEGGPTT